MTKSEPIAARCGCCCTAHDKFVIHGGMGVTVATTLFASLEEDEHVFPHVFEVDLASTAEDEVELFATTASRMSSFDTEDELSKMMTSLDMEIDIN